MKAFSRHPRRHSTSSGPVEPNTKTATYYLEIATYYLEIATYYLEIATYYLEIATYNLDTWRQQGDSLVH